MNMAEADRAGDNKAKRAKIAKSIKTLKHFSAKLAQPYIRAAVASTKFRNAQKRR